MGVASTETELRGLAGLRRQCLFAVTILLVEDSRSASEAIRLYAAESGARVRRADSLHAASRHLAIYRPNVVMVDLGLPDGDGMALIRHLASASTPISAIVALSGQERAAWQGEAIEAGAAACLEKPIASLKAFQHCVLSVLPDAETRRRPDAGELTLEGRASVRAALEEDLRRAQKPPGRRAAGEGRGDGGVLRAVPRLGRRDARGRRARRRRAPGGRRSGRRGAARGAASSGASPPLRGGAWPERRLPRGRRGRPRAQPAMQARPAFRPARSPPPCPRRRRCRWPRGRWSCRGARARAAG